MQIRPDVENLRERLINILYTYPDCISPILFQVKIIISICAKIIWSPVHSLIKSSTDEVKLSHCFDIAGSEIEKFLENQDSNAIPKKFKKYK